MNDEDFKTAVLKRFDRIDKHFKKIDKRFKKDDKRFKKDDDFKTAVLMRLDQNDKFQKTVLKRFDKVDAQFEQVDKRLRKGEAFQQTALMRFDNLDTSFMNLFRDMYKNFDELNKKLDSKAEKADTNRLYDVLDGILTNTTHDDNVRKAIINQQNQHERWIRKLATNTGTHLK